jgi:hypothetical protein
MFFEPRSHVGEDPLYLSVVEQPVIVALVLVVPVKPLLVVHFLAPFLHPRVILPRLVLGGKLTQ